MGLVGEFPGLGDQRRRMIRSPINPMDKCTIVSIYPKRIEDRKPTMQPGLFQIEAGTFENPSILVVGPSSWWREVGEHEPLLEIGVGAVIVADSVVNDYCRGLLECNMNDQKPGIFYIPGDFDVSRVKRDHMPLLLKARETQKKWFMALVKQADILWSRSNGNPLAITEDARIAARQLNIENKPWLTDQHTIELVRCIACGSLRNQLFPICATCKAVADPELAKKLNITFAQ